jgi:hypothetical protein
VLNNTGGCGYLLLDLPQSHRVCAVVEPLCSVRLLPPHPRVSQLVSRTRGLVARVGYGASRGAQR